MFYSNVAPRRVLKQVVKAPWLCSLCRRENKGYMATCAHCMRGRRD